MLHEIRVTQPEDLAEVMAVYAIARQFMQQSGNPKQWLGGYPSEKTVQADIAAGKSFICLNERDEIVAVFYFSTIEKEPTYQNIYEGKWLNDAPYGVIHRVASAGIEKGVMPFISAWCFGQTDNIRIDTHRDNTPMRKSLANLGFQYCGIIYLENGDERLAFQKIRE